jgi:hypothetical protein
LPLAVPAPDSSLMPVPRLEAMATPGVPLAPDLPSGVAAKTPWRLPGAGGGGSAAGWMPSAIRRSAPPAFPLVGGGGGTTLEPREALWVPEAFPVKESNEGGGGTTVAFPAFKLEGTRCAPIGSWGAGAMIADGARLISLSRRPETSTGGGGAITTEFSAGAALWRSTLVGGGATTGAFSDASETAARSVAASGTGTE